MMIGKYPGLLVLLIAIAHTAAAQEPLAKAAAPIHVEVKPSPAAVGTNITIYGLSLALEGYKTIQIAVQPPKGQAETLKAELDGKGEFTTSYTVSAAGSYKVVATSPDGKATAEAIVSVLPSVGVSEQSSKAMQTLIAEMKAGTEKLREQVAQQPPSPPQAEIVEQLDVLTQRLQQGPVVKLRQGMVPLDKLVQQYPEALAELQPAYDALAEAGSSAETMTPEMRKRLQDLTLVNRLCEDIHAANEALGFLSLIMSVTSTAIETLMNVVVDKTLPDRVLSRVPSLARNPGDKFVVAESIKQAYAGAQGYAEFAKAQGGLLNDIAQYFTESMFRQYCEKFEGPIKAVFHLEYFEQGERWYAYDVVLDGKLALRYQKGSGSSIQVRGEFEGAASKFTVWEQLWVVQPEVRRYLVERKAFPPVAVPPPAELGQIGKIGASKLGAPGMYYFNIPVIGLLTGEQLALKFEDARADYDGHAKAKVIYIFMEPLLPIPQLYVGEFPYQGAHYILSRATKREPVFKVGIDKAKNVSRFARTFEREEKDPGSWLVRFKLDVEACNPAC